MPVIRSTILTKAPGRGGSTYYFARRKDRRWNTHTQFYQLARKGTFDMAKPGPKPKPRNLRVIEGSKNLSDLPPAKTKTTVDLKGPPKLLQGPARKHWNYFKKLQADVDAAKKPDELALATMCETLQDFLDAVEEVTSNGAYYWVETKAGGEMRRANPALAIKRAAETRLVNMLAEFGMTPSGRSRLGIDLETAENSKGRFFE